MSDAAGDVRSGVIEGFYGRPWSEAQRTALFARMAGWGLNTYLYAPKDDLEHRLRWRERYDADALAGLARLVEAAGAQGVTFAYGLAPGLDLRFADRDDRAALRARVAQVLDLGVTTVALLFDDVPRDLADPDRERFGTLAAAQADVANRLQEDLRAAGGDALLFCPTDYCGQMARPSVAASPYLNELGEALDPAIEVFWTGPEVVSETIEVAHVREVAAALRRKPLLWDNLHANDYDVRRVHLGPYAGRPSELRREVKGILSNPNVEFGANDVPLATLGAYLRRDDYRPRRAFLAAVEGWAERLEDVDGAHPDPADLAFLADFLYLPFEEGPAAQALLEDVAYLQATPPAAWGATFDRAVATVVRLATVAAGLERLADRELVTSLHRYVQDVLVEAGRAVRTLAARRSGRPPEPPRDGIGSAYGGGFSRRLLTLLPPRTRERP